MGEYCADASRVVEFRAGITDSWRRVKKHNKRSVSGARLYVESEAQPPVVKDIMARIAGLLEEADFERRSGGLIAKESGLPWGIDTSKDQCEEELRLTSEYGLPTDSDVWSRPAKEQELFVAEVHPRKL